MNKFDIWIKNNELKFRGVATRLGISIGTLHGLLKEGKMPTLRIAYRIEQYTKGMITLYDWIDEMKKRKMIAEKTKEKPMPKSTKK